ncbi:MAG: UvrD-helicase domain-containing protein [Firmicutes bacterium]|nr:UvrD-helicase domain-containing protein [Bacillota bacterium]
MQLLADLDREGDVTLNRWRKAEDARAAREAFNDFRQNYITPVLRAWREHRHARLVDFVLPAVELFARRRMEHSKLNFQDLLMNTAALLRENPDVRRYFQERYTHLLVDEFQDTDPIQAEIMFYLAGQDVHEKEWRKLVLRPGALFAVGDPKQAIDPVRLVAVLRGSLFGVNDNQLWRFKQAGGRFNFYSEVPEGLDKKDREIFKWAFGLLRSFRDWTQKLPASAALENIMRELGVIPYALTGELGKSRSGHLFQGLEFLAAAERRGITSFSSLVVAKTKVCEAGLYFTHLNKWVMV